MTELPDKFFLRQDGHSQFGRLFIFGRGGFPVIVDQKTGLAGNTACYRAGRTGDRFIEYAKTGEIAMYCQANAVMTIKEYLCDYASPKTRELGLQVIENELPKITHEKVRLASIKRLKRIEEGERDFRF